MKILIIGGLGYLGSRMAEYLARKKFKITVSTRNKITNKYFKDKSINIINIHWTKKNIDQLVHNYNAIIFVAGFNSKNSVIEYKKCIDFSKKSINLLSNAILKKPIQHFIFISTAHVYKLNLSGTIDEKTKTLNKHPYAISKLISENILLKKLTNSDINLKIIRLSNAFGYPVFKKNETWELLINDICRKLILNKKITLNSNPLIERNFISISEVCRFISKILIENNFLKDIKIINLGSKRSHSLINIVNKIEKIAKKNNLTFKTIFKNDKLKHPVSKLKFNSKYLDNYQIKNNFNYEINMLIKLIKVWYNK